jgi:segregation and condensation protein B
MTMADGPIDDISNPANPPLGDWQVDGVDDLVKLTGDGFPIAHEVEIPLAEPAQSEISAKAANEATVPPTATQIIEAMLFVGGMPVTARQAADAIRGITPDQFRETVDALARLYRLQRRPYQIVQHEGGFVIRVTSRYHSIREKLYSGPRETRLHQAALDVLALIAYRQPISKAEVESLRGSDSALLMRQLDRLGLITGTTTESDTGDKIATYSTTPRFLEVFRLTNIDDLPRVGTPLRVVL